jgi:hypothetical protein
MKVKRGERSNTFCGPAALSLITGKHVDKCVKEVRDFRNDRHGFQRRNVRGMWNAEIVRVLDRMGFVSERKYPFEYDTLKLDPTLVAFMRWLKKRGQWSAKKVYLINVTGHYLVMKGIKLFDNRHPEGVFFGKYDHRRRRVKYVWEVTKRCKRSTSRPVPSGSPRQLAASS